MITVPKEGLSVLATKCGYEYTNDVFIVPSNIYSRANVTELFTTRHPGDVVSYRQVTSSKYTCWNYTTLVHREIDVKTYNTQLSVFNLMIEDEDFYNQLIQEILDNDLIHIVSQSTLLFNQ